jgi:hypothetical protein
MDDVVSFPGREPRHGMATTGARGNRTERQLLGLVHKQRDTAYVNVSQNVYSGTPVVCGGPEAASEEM